MSAYWSTAQYYTIAYWNYYTAIKKHINIEYEEMFII